MQTIPASQIVDVTPNVLDAGGTAIVLNGLMLTESGNIPIGTVQSWPDAPSVGDYFGLGSDEYKAATVYFNGFDNSNQKPGALLGAQYPNNAVNAYLRSGALGLSLAQLNALNGTIIVTVDGSSQTGAVNMASALSFSDGATLIAAALNLQTSMTASIAPNVVVARIDPVTGTGSIAGTTMTISATTRGGYAPGKQVSGIGVVSGTTIVQQLTGTAGQAGTYQVSIAQTVASTTIAGTGGVLTVSAVTTGTLAVGQTLSGSGVTANTKIDVALTGAGGTGTYSVDTSQTVAPGTTVTATGGTLTVSAVSAGTIGLGDVLNGAGVTAGNHVTAFLTGTGTTGTYLVSVGDTVGSEAMTISGANVTVTYDSTFDAFIIKSGTTGPSSTMTYATGTLATSLKLTSAAGAALSQGAAAASPAAFMTALTAISQNWASFFTVQDPDAANQNSVKLAFAAWASSTGNRYAYECWDMDLTPSASNTATGSLGYLIKQAGYSGTTVIGRDANNTVDFTYAAFACGWGASLDTTQEGGRASLSFRSQAGLLPTVTDGTAAKNLIANGYNLYGAYGSGNENFVWMYPGSISGPFKWADSYFNQIWMNSNFQVSLLAFLRDQRSVPYNAAGRTMIEAALLDPINAALNFGSIQAGIELSSSQVSEVNSQAGLRISDTLQTQGWYLQVKPATPTVRAARGSPPCTFWYTDGQSVNQINLTSINVQ